MPGATDLACCPAHRARAQVKTSTVDAADEPAVKTFFSAIDKGSIHHVVCSVGPAVARGNLATDELSIVAFR